MSRKRMRLLPAFAAFLALPAVVAVLVPLLIALPSIRSGLPFRTIALIPLIVGAAVLLWCIQLFLTVGEGTLAPWDPPRRLVASGPYRVSRNPMYIAITVILIGWAVGFASWWLLAYAVAIAIAFDLRVRFYEEPRLADTYRQAWTPYAAATPRWVFRTWGGVIGAGIATIVIAVVLGLLYEAYADAEVARLYPPPGTMVDVGGRRLHLICIGNGERTVLFEPSGWGNATSAEETRARIATRARVCSYDRMGAGWSDPGPPRATSSDLARDLAVLQDRAKLGSPLVLVASSIGGLTAETFAREYPERVAGLVMLDAASSELIPPLRGRVGRLRLTACAASTAARFGVMRLVDPFGLSDASDDRTRRAAAITYGARPWATICALLRGLEDDGGRTALRPFDPALPVRVLSAAGGQLFPGEGLLAPELRTERVASQQRLAKRAPNGTWAMVPKSRHLLADDQPDVVAEAVLGLLDELDPPPAGPTLGASAASGDQIRLE